MTVQQNCIKGRSLGRGRSFGDAIPSASLWSKAVSHRLVAWKVARTARVALRLTAGVTFSVQKGLWRGLRQGGQAIFLRKIWKKAFPSFAFSESPTSTHIQLLITGLTTKLTLPDDGMNEKSVSHLQPRGPSSAYQEHSMKTKIRISRLKFCLPQIEGAFCAGRVFLPAGGDLPWRLPAPICASTPSCHSHIQCHLVAFL